MLRVPVPVLSFVTGEGGSGGALAFAAADRLIAFGQSVFSVIGPEGAAEILWRDPNRVEEAATALHLTASDLVDLGIADELVPGVATAEGLKHEIVNQLGAYRAFGDISAIRRHRWRAI
jgi:acetyl-CoA carboxylase alpha subunit